MIKTTANDHTLAASYLFERITHNESILEITGRIPVFISPAKKNPDNHLSDNTLDFYLDYIFDQIIDCARFIAEDIQRDILDLHDMDTDGLEIPYSHETFRELMKLLIYNYLDKGGRMEEINELLREIQALMFQSLLVYKTEHVIFANNVPNFYPVERAITLVIFLKVNITEYFTKMEDR